MINISFNKNYYNTQNIKTLILILLFYICLYPFSLMTSMGGVSANYLYLFLPFIFIYYNKEINFPKKDIVFFIAIFSLIFVFSSIIQIENYNYFLRRFFSFILFISMFSFVFVKIEKNFLNYFFVAFIFIGLTLALYSLFSYFYNGYYKMGMGAKGLFGTSRYGFIYLFNFWIILFYNFNKFNSKYALILKYLLIFVMLIGCFLTFSRTTSLSLILSFSIYYFFLTIKILKFSPYKILLKHLYKTIFIAFVLFIIFYYFFYWTIFFAFDRLVLNFFTQFGTDVFDLKNYNSSEGYRFQLFFIIVSFLKQNFILGSGFLGIWSYQDSLLLHNFHGQFVGSAHSQYLDVLYRTGGFGFIIYLIILYKLLIYFFKYNKGIFWGLISVSIFGIFHETFKLSYGSFLLAILINMYSNNIYYDKKN